MIFFSNLQKHGRKGLKKISRLYLNETKDTKLVGEIRYVFVLSKYSIVYAGKDIKTSIFLSSIFSKHKQLMKNNLNKSYRYDRLLFIEIKKNCIVIFIYKHMHSSQLLIFS